MRLLPRAITALAAFGTSSARTPRVPAGPPGGDAANDKHDQPAPDPNRGKGRSGTLPGAEESAWSFYRYL